MDDFTEESEKLSTMEDAAGEKLNHAFDIVDIPDSSDRFQVVSLFSHMPSSNESVLFQF